MASIATKQQHQHQQNGLAGQQGTGPQRKHNKKKSKSWKAGFKSTPSSPLQSAVSVKSHQPSSVLTEIPVHVNANTTNTTIAASSKQAGGNGSGGGGGNVPSDKLANKENSDLSSRLWAQSTNMARSRAGSASGILGGEEFLQHVDLQLIKAQLEDSRIAGVGSQGTRPPSKQGSTDRPQAEGFGSTMTDHTTYPIAVSLWDYLKEEMTASDFESTQELKRERIANFFTVPIAFEKMIVFGYFVCLDSFLYTFTILPARFMLALVALFRWVVSKLSFRKDQERPRLKSSQKCDLIKVGLVVVACTILHSVDASRTYHFIRGQNAMKLYAVFNCLEIFDRLCCSFGQDILDSLFSKATLGSQPPKSSFGAARHARPITFTILALLYILAHTMVLFYQMVTLNVAVNSYSNALLTLLISNQFVEIKASVFKRFEKENLFQLSCSDIVERFQLSVFMTIIAVRNLVELSASPPSPFSIFPQSFVPLFSSMTTVARLLTPCLLVLGCETLVDWLKHAFITKFNQIRPTVYGRFVDILCRDLVVGSPTRLPGKGHPPNQTATASTTTTTTTATATAATAATATAATTGTATGTATATATTTAATMFVDQSPMVARRIGLASLPLACLVICVSAQTLQMVLSTLPDDGLDSMAMPAVSEPLTGSVAAAAAARTLNFENLEIDWEMPSVEFSSMGAAAIGFVGVAVWFSKVVWAVFGETAVVLGHRCLAWLYKHGISPEMGHKVLEWSVIILAWMATYACLVAMKLLVGINLLGFAHQRYLTMESREQIERQTDRLMRESAAAKEERVMSSTVSVMLDGRSSGAQASGGGDAFLVGGEKRQVATLDTIERYTLFKSRIP
ncbi:hypothetical protein DFQ26_005970 [Actinomortierella ambigua]|nr:hypothetical protein DFQ26_005970 [Actinomortierella ambigua]